jgi:tetratricopeptide (TPR) repeat protein
LGGLSLQEGRYKDAEDYFRRAYQIKPENPDSLVGIVRTYAAQGKILEAIPILQTERDKFPKRTDIRMILANTSATAKMYDRAISEYQSILPLIDSSNKPGQAHIYFVMGEVYRAKQDYASGIGALRKAMDLVPNNTLVMDSMALMLQGNGQTDEARKVYEQSMKLDPENEITLNNLAYLMAETGGNLDVALTYAQRAKQKNPNVPEISDTLGWIYLKKNLSDNAVEIFQNLVSKNPANSAFHYHLGMAFYQKGDKTKALKELQAALQTNPEKSDEQKIKALIGKISS